MRARLPGPGLRLRGASRRLRRRIGPHGRLDSGGEGLYGCRAADAGASRGARHCRCLPPCVAAAALPLGPRENTRRSPRGCGDLPLRALQCREAPWPQLPAHVPPEAPGALQRALRPVAELAGDRRGGRCGCAARHWCHPRLQVWTEPRGDDAALPDAGSLGAARHRGVRTARLAGGEPTGGSAARPLQSVDERAGSLPDHHSVEPSDHRSARARGHDLGDARTHAENRHRVSARCRRHAAMPGAGGRGVRVYRADPVPRVPWLVGILQPVAGGGGPLDGIGIHRRCV
mmetsp:Transcript_69255/g.225607  ORF Transcript_69255/g.225607 Transcript_69255/m.225607 type:complete len:288 (-) Transcript_69255:2065-2928(-)